MGSKSGYYYENGLFWFKIFGYGIFIKNFKKHPLLFSQRIRKNIKNGGWVIGKYYLQFLKPKQQRTN